MTWVTVFLVYAIVQFPGLHGHPTIFTYRRAETSDLLS